MSFIIKRIDLPKEGETIFLAIKKNTAIETTYKGFNIGYHEAIQISKGHGRLIDADNLIPQEVWIDEMSFEAVDYDDIEKVPTILEAESEE